MAKLHVIVSYHGQVIDDQVVKVQDSVRLGERRDAAVAFPGADILVTQVDGDICWRGRRLREGDRASLALGDFVVDVEHIWPERMNYSQAFSGLDLRFVLVLLGVTVSGMWIDTFNRITRDSPRGEFLTEIGDFRDSYPEDAPWIQQAERSAAVQSVESEEVFLVNPDIWDGPRAQSDDERTGVAFYEWYRRAVKIPYVAVRDVGVAGLSTKDHEELALAAYAADNYEASLSHFQWLEAHHPEQGKWIEGVAASQKRLGMHQLEGRSYQRILEITPDHLAAMGNRAVSLARLGRLGEAQSALDQLKTRYPYQAFSYHCEAMIFGIQGMELEALGALERLFSEFGTLPLKLQEEIRRDLALDPAFSTLRADPRLKDLLVEGLKDGPRPI